jgi:hypothetical protein
MFALIDLRLCFEGVGNVGEGGLKRRYKAGRRLPPFHSYFGFGVLD